MQDFGLSLQELKSALICAFWGLGKEGNEKEEEERGGGGGGEKRKWFREMDGSNICPILRMYLIPVNSLPKND